MRVRRSFVVDETVLLLVLHATVAPALAAGDEPESLGVGRSSALELLLLSAESE